MPEKESKVGPLLAAVAGVALLIGALILGPIEDFFTAGVGIVDDPIAIAMGVGAVGLLIWGISRATGRKGVK